MVFKVVVQEKVRCTGRLVEVACFLLFSPRFFALFRAFSKPKIENKQRNLPEYTLFLFFKNLKGTGQFMVEKVKTLLATQGPDLPGTGRFPLT